MTIDSASRSNLRRLARRELEGCGEGALMLCLLDPDRAHRQDPLALCQDGCRRALAALARAARLVADSLPRRRARIPIPVPAGRTVTTPEQALRRWEAR